MDILYICLGWILLAVGILGCFIPVVPGPPLAYLALFAALATGDHSSPGVAMLVIAGAVTAVVTVLDYVVPAIGAKKFKCSRGGTVGCFVGTFLGMFYLPIGVIAGPFLGALVGELIAGKKIGPAMYGALGALLGFAFGVLVQLGGCGLLVLQCCAAVYR